MLDPFHLQRTNKIYRKYKPVRITQKEHLLILNSEANQNLNSYEAWKNNYGMQLFKIFPSFWIFGQQYYKNESIHLDSWHHSYKKQIDSLETQVVFVDIFAWTWNIWRSRTENTSKQQKMVAFVRNCLVKITLRLSYSISLVMTIVPMLLRQFRRLAQGHCWSYANSLKQLIS